MIPTLLELQRLDLGADALRARRSGLPERTLLQAHEAEVSALVDARAGACDRRTELAREEREAGTLVADLGARSREVEHTLYAGKVKAIKELEALQVELRDCKRRQAEAEDRELTWMEQQEQVEAEIATMDARRDELVSEALRLSQVIAAEESKIDEEIGMLAAQRAALDPPLPPALLAAYEKLRTFPRLTGRAVASAAGGSCGGCRTVLPIHLVSRLHRVSAGEVFQCVNCLRILLP